MTDPTAVRGLLLAAGEGRRMGMPKALVREADGTSWLHRSLAALRDGGCAEVTVVLGAGAAEARTLLDETVLDGLSTWSSPATGPRAWAPPCAPA